MTDSEAAEILTAARMMTYRKFVRWANGRIAELSGVAPHLVGSRPASDLGAGGPATDLDKPSYVVPAPGAAE